MLHQHTGDCGHRLLGKNVREPRDATNGKVNGGWKQVDARKGMQRAVVPPPLLSVVEKKISLCMYKEHWPNAYETEKKHNKLIWYIP